jgi:predicted RNase H-like nuclease (RuvC/YqgF family)
LKGQAEAKAIEAEAKLAEAHAKVEALETENHGLAEGVEELEAENRGLVEKLKRSTTTGEENVSVCEKSSFFSQTKEPWPDCVALFFGRPSC